MTCINFKMKVCFLQINEPRLCQIARVCLQYSMYTAQRCSAVIRRKCRFDPKLPVFSNSKTERLSLPRLSCTITGKGGVVTKAVGLVGYKRLAGVGDLAFST